MLSNCQRRVCPMTGYRIRMTDSYLNLKDNMKMAGTKIPKMRRHRTLDKRMGSGESHYEGEFITAQHILFVEVGWWVSYNGHMRDVLT